VTLKKKIIDHRTVVLTIADHNKKRTRSVVAVKIAMGRSRAKYCRCDYDKRVSFVSFPDVSSIMGEPAPVLLFLFYKL